LVVPKRDADKYYDWPKTGMSAPVTIDGERAYFVDNRGEVLCLDVKGMANGNDGPFLDEGRHMSPTNQPPMEVGPLDADIIWAFDMPDQAGTWPHDGAHSSILVRGNLLYLNTGTGVDNTHKVIRTPDAPSLIVLDKRTGRYLARDDEHIATNIFHATWSSPSMAKVNGRDLIFFCGGNGIVYAFEPLTEPKEPTAAGSPPALLKKVWQFDIDPEGPKAEIHTFLSNRINGPSNIYGMPVFYDGLLYVAGGGDIFWGKNEAWLKCIDPSGSGDITKTGLRWYYALNRHTMTTAAIADGLVYATDTQHTLHCVDAKSGAAYWTHDIGAEVWASPYVADGKVYIGNRRGGFWVMAAGKEKKELSHIELTTPISGTVTAANGVLYLATMTQLYAIAQGAGRQ
jgi:outer membrane protein assembly factor BamB